MIDRIPVGQLQIITVVLCGIVAILDGFDNFAIALVAPQMAHSFNVAVSSFGAVFGVNAFGLMLGALAFGPIADRFGRKPVILASVFLIGLFSLLTPFTGSIQVLLATRFLAGLGMGGVMPSIIALTAEYAPKRLRATLVTVMFAGIPVGAMIAGSVRTQLLGEFAWRNMFYVGGAIPFLLLPVLVAFLPESVRYLVARRIAPERPLAILRRLDRRTNYPDGIVCTHSEAAGAATPISRLFQDGRARATLLLWLIFVCNLLVWFFLTNWMPSILQRAHFPVGRAVVATIILYGGGLAGGLALGRMVDRKLSYRTLALAYAAAALCVAGLAFAATPLQPALLPMIFAAGFFVAGCQYCINAIAAAFYPTDLRSTGVGWALGVGRIGSIAGPAAGGALIGMEWSIGQLFLVAAIPALIAAIAALLLGRSTARAAADRLALATPAGRLAQHYGGPA
ncbi:MAG: MFS transporter [Bradyrhizobium sp.]|nr:MFS transporter [Bradyrhizobium sp.]